MDFDINQTNMNPDYFTTPQKSNLIKSRALND